MIQQFLIKSFFFIALTTGFCFLLQAVVAPKIRDTNAFVGATIDKEKRLAELPSPRLVFVGGSNWAFGLDSKKISDSTHLPVVNMGLHAGLGVAFVLNEAIEHIKKGDKIILSVEYGLTKLGDKKLFSQLVDINPTAANYLNYSFNDRLSLININWQRCVSSLFFAAILSPNEAVYRRDGFSAEGDMTAHLNLPQPANITDKGPMTFRDYSDELTALNAFIKAATEKGAAVYYAFPAYVASEYQLNKPIVAQYEAQFRAQLTCPIINAPDTFVFPDADFFDTAYHLNKIGREKRTERMIDILKQKVL
jgi:hypothetical protein